MITIILSFLNIVCVLYVRGDYANRFDPSDSTQQVIRARPRSQSRRGNINHRLLRGTKLAVWHLHVGARLGPGSCMDCILLGCTEYRSPHLWP